MNDTPKDARSSSAVDAKTQSEGTARQKLGAGVAVLLVLATLFTFLGFVSIWVNRQVLQTPYWTDTSTQLLESQNVQDALGTYIVDEIFTNVDVQGELQSNLPPDLAILAGPATNGLRELALRATDKGLASPQFQEAWKNANTKAHATFIKILNGKGQYANIDQGVVTLDVKGLVTQVADQVGVPGKLVAKLPANTGILEVLQSDELKTAQNAKRVSDVTAWLFPVLALLLYAAAIGTAEGRRRRVVRWAGITWVITGLLVFIGISVGEQPFVDSLASTSALEPAVTDVYGVVTQLLHSMATSVMVTGVLVIIASILAGPSRWATSVRRFDAPYLRDYPVASAAFTALLYLLIIWWAPTMGFRASAGLIINTILVVAGFVAYRQICVKEFPDEEAPDVGAWFGEKWEAVRKSVEGRRGGAFTTARKGVGENEMLDQVERLAALHDRGVLTDSEFAAQKQDLFARAAGRG